jgi:HlyD family type I secretion membrane fusion protein
MNTLTAPSFFAAHLQAAPDAQSRREMRRALRSALLPVAVAAALIGAWAAAAPLSGAVVAPAQFKVELNRKTVAHQEGGIVRRILVRNGQKVRAGEPLLEVGDLRQDAELGLLQDQLRAAQARLARADAQARFAPRFEPPAGLAADAQAAPALQREQAVFDARRRALDEQAAALQDQVHQIQAQAGALDTQIDATATALRLSEEELAMNEPLLAKGYVSEARVLSLRRTAADYRSRIGEQRAELATARQRAGELHGRLAQLRLQYQNSAVDELREATAQVREAQERLRPSRDQVERQTVRAPVDGEVMSLAVAAPGAVVTPRQPLLDVVPAGEKLVVHAQIAPQDIEQVHAGSPAEVRLSASDARRLPALPARVATVSADRMSDPATGRAWFDVSVELDAAALKRHPEIRLQPGLSAELYVTTAQRSLLQYLLKPLTGFTQRAMRES